MTRTNPDSRPRPTLPSALRAHYFGQRIVPMEQPKRSLLGRIFGGGRG